MQFRCNSIYFVLTIFTLALLQGCAGSRPNVHIPKTMPKPLTMTKQPRVALVLGSGGARGFAHLGVLKVLEKAGVPIDLITGASAGATMGVLYADNRSSKKTKAIMMKAGFWDLADISNLPSLKGPIKGYRFQKFLLKHMHARHFKQLHIPVVVATTDLRTGKLFPISSGPIAPAAEASAAMPGAVQPPRLYGHTLIDGGMVDPIPVDLAKKYKPQIIIAVNICMDLDKEMPSTALGIYDRAYEISWNKLCSMTASRADIVIHPKVGTVGTFDIDQKKWLFAIGERAAKRALPKIKRLLASHDIKLNPRPQ